MQVKFVLLATGPENILKRRILEAYFRKLIVQSLYKQLDNNILMLLRYGYNMTIHIFTIYYCF